MPLRNEIHVDQLLSTVSLKYTNSEYIADKVFPIVSVQKDSDLYRVYGQDFRIPETKRANGGLSREHDFHVSTASYACVWHSQKGYVTDKDANNYDISSLRADMTESLTDVVLRAKEQAIASYFTTQGATPLWSLNVSLAAIAAFDATTTVNPIQYFDTGVSTILANGGSKANFAILPRNSYIGFKHNSNVLDRVKHTSREMTPEIIAGLIDVKELLVPSNVYVSSPKQAGLFADTYANIWQQDCSFIGFKPDNPGPMQASVGYTFQKSRSLVKRWRDEEREAEVVEVNQEFVHKIVASLSGYQIRDCV